MADAKVTALTAATAITDDDLLYLVNDPGGAAASRKVTAAVLREYTELQSVAASVTTADVTGVVGQISELDISGLTAARSFVLPTGAATNARCGFRITAGYTAANYDRGLKYVAGAAETLNGSAAGVEVGRCIITNEMMVFKCVSAGAWKVDYEFRIAQACDMELTTSSDGEAVNTFIRPTQATTAGVWTARSDVGSISTVASDRVTVRRTGNYLCTAAYRAKDTVGADKYVSVGLYKNVGATLVLFSQVAVPVGAAPPTGAARLLALTAGDYLFYQYRSEEGGIGALSGQSWFDVVEIL